MVQTPSSTAGKIKHALSWGSTCFSSIYSFIWLCFVPSCDIVSLDLASVAVVEKWFQGYVWNHLKEMLYFSGAWFVSSFSHVITSDSMWLAGIVFSNVILVLWCLCLFLFMPANSSLMVTEYYMVTLGAFWLKIFNWSCYFYLFILMNQFNETINVYVNLKWQND